jgi:hypothetical protein
MKKHEITINTTHGPYKVKAYLHGEYFAIHRPFNDPENKKIWVITHTPTGLSVAGHMHGFLLKDIVKFTDDFIPSHDNWDFTDTKDFEPSEETKNIVLNRYDYRTERKPAKRKQKPTKPIRLAGDEVNINDVKKGWKVIDSTYHTHEVMDNKKGIVRMVRTALIYDPSQNEIGSMYAYKWITAIDPHGREFKVRLTDAQEKQAKKVQAYGF